MLTVTRLPQIPGNPVAVVMDALERGGDALLANEHHEGFGEPRAYAVATCRTHVDVITHDPEMHFALSAAGGQVVAASHPERFTGDGGRYLFLAFLTPTHWRVKGLPYCLPDPGALFRQLHERWQAWGYPALPFPDALARLPTELPEYRSATFFVKAGVTVRGFTGVARYDLLPHTATTRDTLWQLARFAEYRGVGAHTSYGMGRVRILVTPHTPRRNIWEGNDASASLDTRRTGVRGALPPGLHRGDTGARPRQDAESGGTPVSAATLAGAFARALADLDRGGGAVWPVPPTPDDTGARGDRHRDTGELPGLVALRPPCPAAPIAAPGAIPTDDTRLLGGGRT